MLEMGAFGNVILRRVYDMRVFLNCSYFIFFVFVQLSNFEMLFYMSFHIFKWRNVISQRIFDMRAFGNVMLRRVFDIRYVFLRFFIFLQVFGHLQK